MIQLLVLMPVLQCNYLNNDCYNIIVEDLHINCVEPVQGTSQGTLYYLDF